MQWSANPYFQPLFIAGLVGLLNILFISRRLRVPGALPLFGMGLAVIEWAFAYAMEMASRDLSMQIFWGKVQYFGIVSVSVSFLLFAATYAQSQKILESKWLWSIWVFPLVCVVLVWTNEFHHLIWTEITQKNFGSYVIASFGHGPVFYLLVAYSYIMLMAGTVVLVRQAVKAQPEFKSQTSLLVFGVMINWVGNIIYVSGANPIPDLDWTPMGLILSGIVYTVALFQFRFLDLMPVAGETVLESMDEVVIVLDDRSRVVYLNNAFEYYFQTNPKKLIGRAASSAFEQWPELANLCNQHTTVRSELVVTMPKRGPLHFDTRVSNIRWRRGYAMGRVLVLDDVTEQKQAEARATLFYELSAKDEKTDRIPLVLMYRVFDEMIIEVNRSFLLALGFERMKLLGRTMLEARLWEPFQRAEFLRAFNQNRSLKEYSLILKRYNGVDRPLTVSAQSVDIGGTAYVVILAQIQQEQESAPV
ncbi:MAG TPA: histidine kinase N-terminal 7TM domain-containing protein [Anaerolineales bacterium]|nr:histidine kinase N-terminal 7TM domain-containing protein [Anaerolineales bacterium]